ncbi:hypothetical protein M2360_000188 [Rhizobium sp. SG_E_25_P2]|uniref:hypothetical protein n=1 Tax=Rhizobium sp. SG_E_25_P2 TaxID=2879942 RepID=UPI0024732450|nr:hypothetical protein [Rhizobium sp. SG_E_25_P2]MDH6264807.1 hypothetical protein [Rhizobium sp. SG_E_25_P2]
MLTTFTSGVTPAASLKTNSSDQRMSPAFAGAQPLGEIHTQIQPHLPALGLEPEALLANVKTETATALNQTVLQTLAAAVAARMGIERLPDEMLEAFFIRLAAAIERKPLIEQGKIETRAGLKALQIPLSDLGPALRDPSGPVAARLTAKAEAPMAAPQKTAAAGITDSYLQTGSTPARSAETVAMSERNRLSTDNGNLLFQSAIAKTGETDADNASQTQFRTLFTPDTAGFERERPAALMPDQGDFERDTVARRGAGPAASGQHGRSAAGPNGVPQTTEQPARASAVAPPPQDANADGSDRPANAGSITFASDPEIPGPVAKVQPNLAPQKPQDLQDVPPGVSKDILLGADPTQMSEDTSTLRQPRTLLAAVKQTSDALPTGGRMVVLETPSLDPTSEFGEKVDEADMQRRLFRMLTPIRSASEDGSAITAEPQHAPAAKNTADAKDMASSPALNEDVEIATERSARSRDVIGSTLLPSSIIASPADTDQRSQAAPHFGLPFGYVTPPPAIDGFEAQEVENDGRARREKDSDDEDAEEDSETPEQRRERKARQSVDQLLQHEPEPTSGVAVNRDSSEADRAFAYYQRLAGF